MPNLTLYDFWKVSRHVARGGSEKFSPERRAAAPSSTKPRKYPPALLRPKDRHPKPWKRQKIDETSIVCNSIPLSLQPVTRDNILWGPHDPSHVPRTSPTMGTLPDLHSSCPLPDDLRERTKRMVGHCSAITLLPLDIIHVLLGHVSDEGGDRNCLVLLSQTCQILRFWCRRLYLCNMGIITHGTDCTTIKLVDDIPLTAVVIFTGFTELQDGRNIRLELDTLHLVEFNHEICNFIVQCRVSAFCLWFYSSDKYLQRDDLVSSALVSLIGSLGLRCLSITIRKTLGCGLDPPVRHRQKVIRVPTHGDTHLIFLQIMNNVLICKLDASFFCTPPLRLIFPLVLQGASVIDFSIDCPTGNEFGDILHHVHFPMLETFSATVCDPSPILLPDYFIVRHTILENVTLINSVGRKVNLANTTPSLQLPSLKTIRLSASYARWTVQDLRGLCCLHIQPVKCTTDPNSPAFCEAVRSLTTMLISSRYLQFSDDFKLTIEFPTRLTRHIWVTTCNNPRFSCT
ncbi:hypothetical protein GALMADRAFT_862918 [Galerina marginata CBS 339.88]|uniref:Uncharacterized protein n=1 Tax=Galerina marginata (strain CBS 339.88) TaxID=685588 RepID=A0A067TIQ1_GALM3|nr:hypothetical protein GALMADRAFT_862918 [Galerina marginata CBS 339.88]